MKQQEHAYYAHAAELRRFCIDAFTRVDLPCAAAAAVADNLVSADLRGVGSHGVARMPIYIARLRKDLVTRYPQIRISRDAPGTALVDGDNGMGAVVGNFSMRCALDRAASTGIGMALATNSNHFGTAAYYVSQALEHGCIGIAGSNAPPTMAIWGGREPLLGTNPLAYAVPAGRHLPVVLDMATSVVARGKIILAANAGLPIPSSWALDAAGSETTNAADALDGCVLPFGGAKGSAIALFIDILSGVLAGGAFGTRIRDLYRDFTGPMDAGHFFIAIKIDHFLPLDEFLTRMDAMIDLVKASPRAQGVEEILLPGEPEARLERLRAETGIPLTQTVAEQLTELAKNLDVAMFELSNAPFTPSDVLQSQQA